jgi:hypothetical protein
MNQQEKLVRDIETLREAIRGDWQDLASPSLSLGARPSRSGHVMVDG